ncbi:Lrp/AsnC family transcriptional regulator [Granulicella sp. S190]|uniref:Lrp/AsnC family transcriptional regulator n=1 Tax=Granulicella sp. S190 TaxID=1747226 RepID=UPI00131C6AA3|nr:Lrp/AsnC family transcriptional regulator [Granulicella sp. S190]
MAQDLDPIDYNILRMLAEDARVSYAELGRKVGLSPSAIAERIHQLESSKVILGYRALLDEKAFGYSVIAFIRLTCDNTHYRPFLKFLPTIDAVLECHHITGGEAFLIKVRLSSIDQLEPLIERLLPYGMPTTSMVLSTPVNRQQEAWLLKHAGLSGRPRKK